MSGNGCGVELARIVDYLLGELPAAEAETFETHAFECASCAERIESVERIGAAVPAAVRSAEIGANVNAVFLERLARDGLTLREYRIPAGETVACSAGPEDFVVVRLAADFGDAKDLVLDVEFHDLDCDERLPVETRGVAADRERDEVVLVFPGEVVRGYPRSRWTLRVHGELPSGRAEFGPFVMDHTP